jgi:hypothetical protein
VIGHTASIGKDMAGGGAGYDGLRHVGVNGCDAAPKLTRNAAIMMRGMVSPPL